MYKYIILILLTVISACSKILDTSMIENISGYYFSPQAKIIAQYRSYGLSKAYEVFLFSTKEENFVKQLSTCKLKKNRSPYSLHYIEVENLDNLHIDSLHICSDYGILDNKIYDIRFYDDNIILFRYGELNKE